MASLPAFPRSNDRGLIEAIAEMVSLWISFRFPRSNDRGLIEASFSPGRPYGRLADFRDLTIAASLKRLPIRAFPYSTF